MNSSSGTKNPPWARSNVNSNMTGLNPQIMDPNAIMNQQGMMGFQQTSFNSNMMGAQGGIAMPMGGVPGQMPINQMTQGQMYPGNVVAYPTPRGMNQNMYQGNQSSGQPTSDQRVFTGTVTKTHNDFGFVDQDVFYQTSVCANGVIPKVNDRVLVEATYNPNMPFKWNATRVQVLPRAGQPQKNNQPKNNYSAVPPPPPNKNRPMPPRRDERPIRREERKRSRSRSRSRSRDHAPIRRDTRRDSPPRKRPVVHAPSPVRSIVRMPRIPLEVSKLDVPGLSQRYSNLYIPSDFFTTNVKWCESFPPQAPFTLNNPAAYHILSKEVDNPVTNDAVLEPPDADYRYSAKVMLISLESNLESVYQKCGLTKGEEKDRRNRNQSLSRFIKFLVGVNQKKGKSDENFAIGGPWSPSLDGENPDSDPTVLVKTAIRTCKALTGIDLSSCTQWYRMVEYYYWRESSGGRSRLETVVLFVPDVWTAQPSKLQWSGVQDLYKTACEAAIAKLDEQVTPKEPELDNSQIDKTDANVTDTSITVEENDGDDNNDKPVKTHFSKIELKTIKVDQLRKELQARDANCRGNKAQLLSRLTKLLKEEEEKELQGEKMEIEDDDAEKKDNEKELSSEKTEEKKEDEKKEDEKKGDEKKEEKKDTEKKEEKKDTEKSEKEKEEEKRKLEKEKQNITIRYQLPTEPHIIVHPSNTAKGGKFSCAVSSLATLLDYRITDNKEHSFEIFVFAELFNEMLMRDFGFYIYKTLYTLPEKADPAKEKEKESKEKEKSIDLESEDGKKPEEAKKDEAKDAKKDEAKDGKKDDAKNGKKDEAKDGKKDEVKDGKKEEAKDGKKEDKKDERRDDRRDSSRRRTRKDSISDDERSNSPKRSRGVELPPDPYLLLCLTYFDSAHSGQITRKDLQTLFLSLGLQLSRSQIKSILDKVCIREVFNFRPLIKAIQDLSSATDIQELPLDSIALATPEVPAHIAELETTIAAGNRNLLPVFGRPGKDGEPSVTMDVSDSGMVTYKSRIIDIGALVAAEARSAQERARLTTSLEAARIALRAARAAAASTQQAERGAQSQLSDVSASLRAARARITSLTASAKIFHSALKTIHSKADSVISIKFEDDDVVEIVNGPYNKVQPKREEDKKQEMKPQALKKEEKEKSEETKAEIKTDKSPAKTNVPVEMEVADKKGITE